MLRLGVAFCFAPESGKIMSYPAVIAFYRMDLRFWFDILFFRYQFSVALPAITKKALTLLFFLSCPIISEGGSISFAAGKVYEFSSFSVNGDPDPVVVFFSRHRSVSRPVRALQENLKSLEILWSRQISWSNNKLRTYVNKARNAPSYRATALAWAGFT